MLTVRADSTAWATQVRLLAGDLVRRLNAGVRRGHRGPGRRPRPRPAELAQGAAARVRPRATRHLRLNRAAPPSRPIRTLRDVVTPGAWGDTGTDPERGTSSPAALAGHRTSASTTRLSGRSGALSPPGRVRVRAAPVVPCLRGTPSRTEPTGALPRVVRRCVDHRPRGSRRRPQAAGHVHRLDRRARPAPPGLRGGRQLRRRGAGRVLRHDRRHPAGRRRRPGGRQRPRHPGRRAPGREAARRRGRADRAARRRQVRRRAATRSPAACTASASRSSTRCPPASTSRSSATAAVWTAVLPARRADRAAAARGRRRPTTPARPSRSGPTRRSSRPPTTTSRPCPGASRRWRSSTRA